MLAHSLSDEHRSALSALHRRFLVAYAELNIRRPPGPQVTREQLALGRVQSLYIANALATIEPAKSTPFQNSELAAEYRAQQRYMVHVLKAHPL